MQIVLFAYSKWAEKACEDARQQEDSGPSAGLAGGRTTNGMTD